jgi:surface carbohydrate biosynthesis protein
LLSLGRFIAASPPRADLLVFDQVSASELGPKLLRGMKFAVLCKRRECYFVGLRVIMNFLGNLARRRWWSMLSRHLMFRHLKGLLYVAYLLAWVQCVRPRVVITFIDNDWQFQVLSRLYPAAFFIAIQNGVRSEFNLRVDLPPPPHPGSRISMPLMYCFGRCEMEAYPAYGHLVDRLIPIGSLRASWYRATIALKSNLPIIYDILLMSQWERTIMNNGCYPEIARSLRLVDAFLKKFVSARQLRFAIALRGDDADEVAYFHQIYGQKVNLLRRNVAMMSSYTAADQAEVVVVLDSTIGREAYGWGRKVLFANLTGYSMYRTPVDPTCYTEDKEYKKFEAKLDRLVDEPYDNFLKRTQESREWLVEPCRHSDAWTHVRIRTHLEQLLS